MYNNMKPCIYAIKKPRAKLPALSSSNFDLCLIVISVITRSRIFNDIIHGCFLWNGECNHPKLINLFVFSCHVPKRIHFNNA